MGMNESKPNIQKINILDTLKQDRFIDVDPPITIGICGRKQGKNPIGAQCLRINDEPYLYSLQSYHKTENSLCYEFDQNVKLCFMKQHNETIVYNLQTTNTNKTKKMDTQLIERFKPMHLASNEFDLINDFIKEKK